MHPVRHESSRFLGRSAAGLIVLALVALALTVTLWTAAVPLAMLDAAVARSVNALVTPHPSVVDALQAGTVLGATLTGVVVLGTLALALLARGLRRLAGYVAVTAIGAGVLGPAVKELIGRVRPVVDSPVATAPGPSFPSGHALTVTVWIGVILLVLLPAVPARGRRVAVVVGAGIVLVVGLTRIGLGVHYLSDVVGGWLLGLCWLAVTATAFRTWNRLPGAAATRGLEPAAAPELAPAPASERLPPHPWILVAQLLVAAVLLLGALIGAGLLVTRVEAGSTVEAADVAAVQWFVGHRTAALDPVSDVVDELGNTAVVIGLGVAAAVLGLAILRRWRPVLLLAAALVGELAIFLGASSVIERPRPPVLHLDEELPPTSSFPSGHVAAAICLYGAVAVLVFCATRAWWRWLVVAAASAVVVLVALARLYRGAHHPSDVLASVLFAVPWLLVAWWLLRADGAAVTGEPGQP